jgi:hypothetical protein
MKTKLLSFGAIATFSALSGWIIYLKIESSNKDKIIQEQYVEIDRLIEEKKTELKSIRDSAQLAIKKEVKEGQKRFDSIINIPPRIQYIRYEEKIYVNRSLDDALRVHAEYKRSREQRAKAEN